MRAEAEYPISNKEYPIVKVIQNTKKHRIKQYTHEKTSRPTAGRAQSSGGTLVGDIYKHSKAGQPETAFRMSLIICIIRKKRITLKSIVKRKRSTSDAPFLDIGYSTIISTHGEFSGFAQEFVFCVQVCAQVGWFFGFQHFQELISHSGKMFFMGGA
jgi:hypothetical protein